MADAYSCIAQAVPDHITARYRAQAEAFRAQHGIEPRPWYRITNQTADEAEVMLYDEVGGWFGATADDFIAELRQITAPRMRVRVNSPGGSVFEGMAIASMLRAHPADITVRVDGIAASIASVIAMAGDRVVMMPGSTLMIHDASGMCLGDAADMAKMAELLDLLSNNIADIYAAKAGGTRDEWRTKMRDESWYLAQEAVDAGLADEVASMDRPEQDAPEMRKAWDLKAYGYAGPEQPETAPATSTALTIDVGALLGEQFVERLRASVLKAVQPEPPAVADTASGVHHTATENSAEPADDTVDTDPAAAADTPATDDWAADVAPLFTDPADDWAADLTHLIGPDASSSAATAHA